MSLRPPSPRSKLAPPSGWPGATVGTVLHLRENFTAYAAAYVVLALGLEAPLITSDPKMKEASRLGLEVQLMPVRGS